MQRLEANACHGWIFGAQEIERIHGGHSICRGLQLESPYQILNDQTEKTKLFPAIGFRRSVRAYILPHSSHPDVLLRTMRGHIEQTKPCIDFLRCGVEDIAEKTKNESIERRLQLAFIGCGKRI